MLTPCIVRFVKWRFIFSKVKCNIIVIIKVYLKQENDWEFRIQRSCICTTKQHNGICTLFQYACICLNPCTEVYKHVDLLEFILDVQ